MDNIIKGNELMLFIPEKNDSGAIVGYKSIAYATAHTLSVNGETSDTSSKDHGVYGAQEVTKINWEITTENLYTENSFNELYDAMISLNPIKLVWSTRAQNDPNKTVVDGNYKWWTPNVADPTDPITNPNAYTGNAYITSLSANANNGENATFSATFTGAGAFVKGDPVPASTDPTINTTGSGTTGSGTTDSGTIGE